MSSTVVTSICVGFLVEESDFWDTTIDENPTCSQGHPQDQQMGPFCQQDGTKFVRRSHRAASAKFKALVLHRVFSSWVEGHPGDYERLYERICEDPHRSAITLRTVNRRTPLYEGKPKFLALSREIAVVQGWVSGDLSPLAINPEEILNEIAAFERIRQDFGFSGTSSVFLCIYYGC